MPHTRAAEAVGLAVIVTPHVGVGMSDTLGRLSEWPHVTMGYRSDRVAILASTTAEPTHWRKDLLRMLANS